MTAKSGQLCRRVIEVKLGLALGLGGSLVGIPHLPVHIHTEMPRNLPQRYVLEASQSMDC